ncbi:6-phosphofructokinase [Solitalea koreensis]|uniref:ATP-dependent 6-phosphofructokinase n=1 Tax=Solitalea koreensis TaxID=543615 RepID=A0A521E5J1_9SPHI|nr:6-phosphofructokinase [Solitalea koreensis]SMO79208.1 6-phosphofructokinase [Solitalea koreensis]
MSKNIERIAVLTSGGDAPGMNAAIRSVVRSGIYFGKQMFGISQGYQGMINNEITPLNSKSVSNIVQRGGTILKTARCMAFKTPEGRKTAYENLKHHKIDALIVIGGDGTFTGAEIFSREYNMPVIGIPGTIDNDLFGTDFTIGFDTANNTVIEAIDKIRDTAASHDRLFFVEVMGRDAGHIALWSAIGGGAEAVLIPEKETHIDDLVEKLMVDLKNQKTSSIVIVAEGDHGGGAFKIAEKVKERFNYDTKVSILGHLQRGGSPTSFDRVLASRLGQAAVEGILKGKNRKMVGIISNRIEFTDLTLAIKNQIEVDESLIDLVNILAI